MTVLLCRLVGVFRWVLIRLWMCRWGIGLMRQVGWAVSNGLMEGVGGGRFDLEGVVPRWQIVSALYGAFGLAGGKGEAGGVPVWVLIRLWMCR